MANELTLASLYPAVTQAHVMNVLKLMTEGETLGSACKKLALKPAQIRAAIRKDVVLQELHADALSQRNEMLNDMLVHIDDYQSDSRMASVVSKNIMWVLERNEPEKFGDRTAMSNANDEATKALARALDKALDRIPGLPGQRVPPLNVPGEIIDVEIERVVDDAELRRLGLL